MAELGAFVLGMFIGFGFSIGWVIGKAIWYAFLLFFGDKLEKMLTKIWTKSD